MVAEVVTGSPPPSGVTVKSNVSRAPKLILDSSRLPGGGVNASVYVHVTVSPASSRMVAVAPALVTTLPPAVQSRSVSVQPAGTSSVTVHGGVVGPVAAR